MPKKPSFHIPTLKAGGTIGIVSPGSCGSPGVLGKGRALLEKHGYRVVIHPQNYMRSGQLAGSDAARAGAIMDMFANPKIDAVMCARGGNGSIRLIDRLDYKIIKRHPKPFIGYSDITVLLQAISQRCGFAAYHGPMLASLGRPHDKRTVEDFFAAVGGAKRSVKLSFSGLEAIRPGHAEGMLSGGNMTLLQNLVGTPFDWPTQDTILFIEDTDEILYRIDRMLNHFRLAGKFGNVRAVLVGEMVDVPDGETSFMRKGERPYGRSLRQILLDNIPAGIPVCANFPCGHGKYLTTLPVGGRAKLTLKGNRVELEWTRG